MTENSGSYEVSSIPPEAMAALDVDPFWRPQDRVDALRATTFEEVRDIAIRIAGRMPKPLCAVCGPIRSGGRGDVLRNLLHFQTQIGLQRAYGRSVFNQLPFECHLWRIASQPGKQAWDILTVFYEGLFQSGHISELLFTPAWRSSKGALWEHDRAIKLGIPRTYL